MVFPPWKSRLAQEWPGLDVSFEHTGWSSNWGRDLDRLVKRANEADSVVMMTMMRTTLGRRIRESLDKPWVACTATGRDGMLHSIRRAGNFAVRQMSRAGVPQNYS